MGDLRRRVELSTLLARVTREVRHKKLVGVAKHVLRLEVAGSQVEPVVIEILQQVLELGIPGLGVAEVGLAVEVNVAEHAGQLRGVVVLDLLEDLVDAVADIGLGALGIENGKVAARREYEPLPLHRPLHAGLVAAILLQVPIPLVGHEVGYVLDEEQDQNVVLVLRGIDRPSQCVARLPDDIVDVFLGRYSWPYHS